MVTFDTKNSYLTFFSCTSSQSYIFYAPIRQNVVQRFQKSIRAHSMLNWEMEPNLFIVLSSLALIFAGHRRKLIH